MSTENVTKSLSVPARIVMLTSGIPAAMCFTTLSPILPKLEAALAHDPTDQILVKMVVSVSGVAMVFGAPLAGFFADRIGRAPLMAWAMFMATVFGCLGFFISDLHIMVLGRFLLGLAAATALTAGATMIGDLPDASRRRRFMGIHASLGAAAAILTVPLAGILADISWRVPFLLFSIFFPLGLIAQFGLKNAFAPSTTAQRAEAVTEGFPIPWALTALGFLCGNIAIVPLIYVPFRFRDLGVTSATQIGFAMTAQAVATVLTATFFGNARRHITSSIAFAFAFGVAGIGLAIIALTTDYTIAAVGTFIMGMGMGWLSPNIMSRTSEASTVNTRGRALGLVKGVYLMAAFVITLIFEPILRAGGTQAVLFVITAIAFTASLAFVYSDRGRPQDLTQPAAEGVGLHS